MKPLAIILVAILLWNGNIAHANSCRSFYRFGATQTNEATIQNLAERIAEMAKSTSTSISTILMDPAIQVEIRSLKKLIPGLDGILKAKIKEIQNRPEPKIVELEKPKPRIPLKRIEKILVESELYEPVHDIGHLFDQNPDHIFELQSGRLLAETRYAKSEVLNPKPNGSFEHYGHLSKTPGSVQGPFAELTSGTIVYYTTTNNKNAMMFIPMNPSVRHTAVEFPGTLVGPLKALPNGHAILGDNDGKLLIFTESSVPNQRGTYTYISTKHKGAIQPGTAGIMDIAVFPNNDFVTGDYSGQLEYYRWDQQRQTHVYQYTFQNPPGSGKISSVELLKDGRIATAGYDGHVRIWELDPKTNQYLTQQNIFLGGFVWNARELPNGNLVVNNNQAEVYILSKDGSGKFTPHELEDKMIGMNRFLTVLKNGNFIISGDPTLIDYMNKGFHGQVKEVYIWKPIVKELEVEVDIEDMNTQP